MHIFQAISFFFCFLFFFSKKKRKWWAQMDSNHRPHAYQACALTTWAMRPVWWRWGGSNSCPPACKAGALPAELHPHCLTSSFFNLPFSFRYPQNWTMSFSTFLLLPLIDLLEFKHFCLLLLRKEVIQPQVPLRLPCYDFTPVINPTFDCVLLAVRLLTSGVTNSHGVTGGVYKARERIHRSMLICDY